MDKATRCPTIVCGRCPECLAREVAAVVALSGNVRIGRELMEDMGHLTGGIIAISGLRAVRQGHGRAARKRIVGPVGDRLFLAPRGLQFGQRPDSIGDGDFIQLAGEETGATAAGPDVEPARRQASHSLDGRGGQCQSEWKD